MTILDIETLPSATNIFEVELTSLENEIKIIKYKYEPVITIRHIRQACKIKIDNESLSKIDNKFNDFLEEDFDEKPTIKKINRRKHNSHKQNEDFIIYPKQPIRLILQFKNFPEFINIGDNVIINDNLLRAFGVINNIVK